jgi:hypothetical protein
MKSFRIKSKNLYEFVDRMKKANPIKYKNYVTKCDGDEGYVNVTLMNKKEYDLCDITPESLCIVGRKYRVIADTRTTDRLGHIWYYAVGTIIECIHAGEIYVEFKGRTTDGRNGQSMKKKLLPQVVEQI